MADKWPPASPSLGGSTPPKKRKQTKTKKTKRSYRRKGR